VKGAIWGTGEERGTQSCLGSLSDGVVSYMRSTWGSGVESYAGSMWGRSYPVCWREPCPGGSLVVVEPALDTGREVRWRPTGERVGLDQSHEQGPHVGVGLRPAYTCGLEAVTSCALKGSGSGRRLRIRRWVCGVWPQGKPWSGVASYMGSNWGVRAASNGGSLWEWQPRVPWRKPNLGESLALEGTKQ
jgi:hypothetical protein